MNDHIESTPTARTVWYDPEQQQQELLALLDRFGTWLYTERVRSALGKQMLDDLREQENVVRERLRANFTLVVVGNFKNGKSSLINALLGADVVTTNVTSETVTINQIRYGSQVHAEAILVDGGRLTLLPEDLAAEKLVPILTEV